MFSKMVVCPNPDCGWRFETRTGYKVACPRCKTRFFPSDSMSAEHSAMSAVSKAERVVGDRRSAPFAKEARQSGEPRTLYELDGYVWVPETLTDLEPAEVRSRSRVPLPHEMPDGRGGLSLSTKDHGVIYHWRKGVFEGICVNANYPTDFLGVRSRDPESVLIRAGYQPRVRTPTETHFGMDGSPSHCVSVHRADGRFTEIWYAREDIEDVVQSMREYNAKYGAEYGPMPIEIIRRDGTSDHV